jgi:hypothetical protein
MTVDAEGNRSGSLLALEQVSKHLISRYTSLQTSLEQVPGRAVYDTASLFRSIINTENLLSEISGVTTVTVGENVVYLVNNEVGTPSEFEFVLSSDGSLPHNGRQGIIIATGSVRVSGEYTGLILSGKDILLNGGASVKASEAVVNSVLTAANPTINRYFRAYETGSPAGGTGNAIESMKISELIGFSNWKKNEE